MIGCFQFLGIPPKGERKSFYTMIGAPLPRFQFLGIPPKGEQVDTEYPVPPEILPFPISRDPPEGGTSDKIRAQLGSDG